MAFVPNYRHDIFVSYAHVDDELLPGADKGWVTTLVSCIKTRLAQKLGRRDAYKLWIDHELASHVKITPQIMDTLRETAILLLILSPGYIASKWCQRERNTFMKLVQELDSSRVFVVEREAVEKSDLPIDLSDLKGFKFWVRDREGKPPRILGSPTPDKGDPEYYRMVDDISEELATELRELAVSAKQRDDYKKDHAVIESPSVFLAQVTDDLEQERNGVKRYLKQAGILTLPESWYSLEPNDFRNSVKNDLNKCSLFVQLLSGITGKKPPDLPQGYVKLQLEIALSMGKPVLQWRSPKLDTTLVDDEEHLEILDANTVRAERLEDFKCEIRRRILEKPKVEPQRPLNTFVFVNMETSDRPIAEQVCDVLDSYGVDYVLPVESSNPAENRLDLEQNLLNCDGIIVIYGTSTVTWVRSQLLECRKILASRNQPLRGLAVFEGPPPEKNRLDLKMRDMHIINCRKEINKTKIWTFLDSLQQEVS